MLTHDGGDGHTLRTKAFCNADVPLATDDNSGCGRLLQHAAGRCFRAVEAVLYVQIQAQVSGHLCCLCNGEAGEVRHGNFCTMDSEAHGGERRDEGDDSDRHHNQQQAEETKDHAGDLLCDGCLLMNILDHVFNDGGFFEHLGHGTIF